MGGHVTAGGERVRVRLLEPQYEDAVALRSLFHRLSPDSVYRRFLTPIPAPPPFEMARRLLDIDHWDREALGAFSGDQLIGVARYNRSQDDPGVAEVAVVVADDWQHRGLGRALLARLGAVARRRRIRSFHSTMLGDNRPAVELLRSRFPASRYWWEGGILEADSPLRPANHP